MKRAWYMLCAAFLLNTTVVVLGLTQESRRDLSARLDSMRIPEVQFREASLADVIDYLSRETVRLDPQKRGVNFVLMNVSGKSRAVTMQMQNAPLSEVLRYLAELAGVQVRVDKYAVVFLDPDAVVERRMETRVYPVSAGVVETKIPPEARRPQLGRVEGR